MAALLKELLAALLHQKQGSRCPQNPLDEEPSQRAGQAAVPPYRFVRGAADGEGGGVAAGFCHLQAGAEVIVKHQLPIPDGQTQELTLGEAGRTISPTSRCPACSRGAEPDLPLVPVGAGPAAGTLPHRCDDYWGFICKEQPCAGARGWHRRLETLLQRWLPQRAPAPLGGSLEGLCMAALGGQVNPSSTRRAIASAVRSGSSPLVAFHNSAEILLQAALPSPKPSSPLGPELGMPASGAGNVPSHWLRDEGSPGEQAPA